MGWSSWPKKGCPIVSVYTGQNPSCPSTPPHPAAPDPIPPRLPTRPWRRRHPFSRRRRRPPPPLRLSLQHPLPSPRERHSSVAPSLSLDARGSANPSLCLGVSGGAALSLPTRGGSDELGAHRSRPPSSLPVSPPYSSHLPHLTMSTGGATPSSSPRAWRRRSSPPPAALAHPTPSWADPREDLIVVI